MATTYNASYKRFNGLDWDTFYFETSIAQVNGLQNILDGLADITNSVYYVEGNTTGTEGTWIGSISGLTQYYNGLKIAFRVGLLPSTSTTLNINNLGAIAILGNSGSFSVNALVDNVLYLTYVTISGTGYFVWSDATGSGSASVTVGDTPPTDPTPELGDLWWDSSIGTLFIYYDDGTSQQWVEASASATGGVYSVNGQTGTVVLDAADVGAVDLTGDTMTGELSLPSIVIDGHQVTFNEVDGTFDFELENDVVLQLGQEIHFYGKAQGDIANGDSVQFAGVQGDHILMKKSVAAEITAAPEYFIGVATQTILNGEFGYVTWFGYVRNVDTVDAGYNLGDILYVNTNIGATNGTFTTTEPSADNGIISAAVVVKEETGAANNGILLVRPKHVSRKISEIAGLQAALDLKADDLDLTNHINDTTIHFTQSEISITELQISDFGNYEPAFNKNTAFNKNFGTTADTVAEGNHTHTFSQITSKPTTLSGYGITDGVTTTSVQALHATDALSIVGNVLYLNKADGTNETVDLSIYLDDTNLARIVSGVYVPASQVLRFTRDDASTFDVDASMFFDDTNLVTSVTGGNAITVNQSTGAVIVNHADTSSQASVDNSGFTYIQDVTLDTYGHVTGLASSTWSHPDTSTQASVDNSGATVIQDVSLDGAGHVTSLGSVTITPALIGAQPAGTYDNYSSWTLQAQNSAGTSLGSSAITSGDTAIIKAGTNVTLSWANDTVTINSTDTNTTYSAGGGLSLSGTTFSHTDTSSAANLAASSRTYVTALTFDTYGHVTGYSTGTETVVDTNTVTRLRGTTGGTFVSGDITLVPGGATSISQSGNTITISSTDTNTDTNNYLTGVSGSGNGTVSFTRTGLSTLTWNAAHTHDDRYYTESESNSLYVPIRSRANWNNATSVIDKVIGQLAWKNYGNNHTIFDASAGTSPDGTAVNNTNPSVNWTGTYPTLMGWNGSNTYGVRVDSARVSDNTSGNAATATTWQTARTLTIGNTGKSVNGGGNVSWTLAEIGAYAASNPSGYTTYSANQAVNTTSTPTFAEVYNNGWFRNNSASKGLYNQATTQHWYSTANGTWKSESTTTFNQIQFSTSGNIVRGSVYADNANNIGFLTSGGAWRWRIDNSGSLQEGTVPWARVSGAPGFLTGNQTITLSGDASGSGTTSIGVTVNRIDGIDFRNGNSTNGTNPNNINENGTSYITSVSLFGQTDGALYSQAYSTSWVHQIYGDYRTGQLAVRGRNNGTLTAWRTIWDSSNLTNLNQLSNGPGYITSSASISGNAATATTLQTTRSINGTNFNGSANITTANWGTTRTIFIGSTGKSVNGGGNVSWSINEIGAYSNTNPSNFVSSGLIVADSLVNSITYGRSYGQAIIENGSTRLRVATGFIAPTGSSTARSISFNTTFARPPAVFIFNIKASSTNTVVAAKTTAVTTTGCTAYFTFRTSTSNGYTPAAETHAWVAIGY
jgi:hypothetical protein